MRSTECMPFYFLNVFKCLFKNRTFRSLSDHCIFTASCAWVKFNFLKFLAFYLLHADWPHYQSRSKHQYINCGTPWIWLDGKLFQAGRSMENTIHCQLAWENLGTQTACFGAKQKFCSPVSKWSSLFEFGIYLVSKFSSLVPVQFEPQRWGKLHSLTACDRNLYMKQQSPRQNLFHVAKNI